MILFPVTPIRNQHINAIFVDRAVPEEVCDRILNSLNEKKWEKGLVGGTENAAGFEENTTVRSMVQQRLPVDAQGFPLNAICQIIGQANSEFWNFDLHGFIMDD